MKFQLVALLLFALGSAALAEEFTFEQGFGTEPRDKRYAKLNTSEPLSGKQSLEINTLTGAGEWNPAWSLPKGILKPGKSYTISLTAKVLERQTDRPSQLLLLIRPLSAGHPNFDAGNVFLDFVGKTETVKFKVAIPDGIDDYSLQCHTRFGVKALVDDISVTPAEDSEIPVKAGEAPVAAPEQLPTGAAEFKVEPPSDRNVKSFNAREFGVTPESKNNTEAFIAMIAAIRKQTPAKLLLEPGTYRFEGDQALLFDSVHHFILDGQGAKLVFLRSGGPRMLLGIYHCMNSEFRNFTIDWDWDRDPIASLVKVESVSDDGKTAVFQFLEYDQFPKKEVRAASLTRYDLEHHISDPVRPLGINLEFIKGQNKPETRMIGDNRIEVTARNAAFRNIAPGEVFLMRHYVYDINAIDFKINRNLTLDNVRVDSAPGMGFLISGAQHHWQFLNCAILPPEGTPRRQISTAADGIHIGSSAGFFKMENCEVGYTADDAMNFHDLNGFAIRLDDHRIRATNLNYHPGNYFQLKDRIELRNDDFSPTGFTGTVTELKRLSQKECEFTFAEKVPMPSGSGFVLFNRRLGTKNVIVRNCRFHHFPRGLLLAADDVTIENNRFEHGSAAGIKLETGYTFSVWSEGYGNNNVVIRNNRFDSVNDRGRYPNENRPDIYINSYMRVDPSLVKSGYPPINRILIEGNEFRESTGAPVFVCTASDVTIRGNTFLNQSERFVKDARRGAIGICNSHDVRIINNIWKNEIPGIRTGILYDPESTSGIVAGGNRVEPLP